MNHLHVENFLLQNEKIVKILLTPDGVHLTIVEPHSGAGAGFQVRGGGAHLKKLLGTIFGVFRVKNHDYTPKNHIFSNFRGGGGRAPPPPLDQPLSLVVENINEKIEIQENVSF